MHNTAGKNLNQPKHDSVIYGTPKGYDALVLAKIARSIMQKDQILMHIALDDARIHTLKKLLAFFAPDISVVTFPAWDCLPYDRVSPHKDIISKRVVALCKILEWKNEKKRYPRIVLTNTNAALQRVMPRKALKKAKFTAKSGAIIDIENLQQYLVRNGYTRSNTVREHGEFAVRGGLIDIYPSGYKDPVRFDLFGDEIETIRTFNPINQRTQVELKEVQLYPVSEFFLNDESVAKFRAKYRQFFGAQQTKNPLYSAISEKRFYNGAEHWLPLFYKNLDTLFDYTFDAKITCDFHTPDAYKKRIEHVQDFYNARIMLTRNNNKSSKNQHLYGDNTYNPIIPSELYILQNEWSKYTNGATILSPFSVIKGCESTDNNVRVGRNFFDVRSLPDGDVFKELSAHISTLQEQGMQVFIAAYSNGSKARLQKLMHDAGIENTHDIANYKDAKKINTKTVGLCVIPLEKGFVSEKIAFISEQDILGDRLSRKTTKRRKAENFLKEVSSLSEGDLVVHLEHGIGRFISLETINAAGIVNDCLKIEYAGGDKLYVPVVNLDVLSRFGSDNIIARLDKLGGAGWQACKSRAKKNLMEIADKLLEIAAARHIKKAQSLKISDNLYNEFAARFPYEETEDQQRSISAVLDGIAGTYPIDHLVCGDVGFGKTEVALRAAYVAAMSDVQVAVIVPTTLLARQHYQNFIKRFEGTGIQIEQLSRMVSKKNAERTKESLAKGSVQIVIGTHALFAKSIKFANLGLLIIDEEQRFGVKQKEKLKELKSTVHVLTLTATPIPRTLQMSLTGVKEMSLITTPPVDRLAVRTFITPLDTVIIRDALLREYYRGGQSFYVVPRIKDLKEISDILQEIVPELSVIKAHGQLRASELDERMGVFYDGQYNVLLATNIIESGIDIPNANTMIIHHADMFGLSQLYQMRGRIGRSKQRAYAYLTHKANKSLSKNAQKRLEIMETLDTLGSGFQLASHDMDIRGAGNLLGDSQSGHIREIGVELYQQMLEEAVAAARAGITNIDDIPENDWSPQINLGASVLIPETYVEDLGVRLSLYRRLNNLHDKQEIEEFAAEMIDRFGAMPEEVENLLEILYTKQLCKNAGVSVVDAGAKGAIIGFYKNQPPNVKGLMDWITRKAGTVKIRPDQKIAIIRNWPKPINRIKGMQTLLKELASLSPEA